MSKAVIILQRDRLVVVKQVWQAILLLAHRTKEHIFVGSITKSGKRQPKTNEKMKERDGHSGVAFYGGF